MAGMDDIDIFEAEAPQKSRRLPRRFFQVSNWFFGADYQQAQRQAHDRAVYWR